MLQWFHQLDAVLRGDAARQGRLGDGPDHVSARGLALVGVLLSAVYGLSMGSFAVIRSGGDLWVQLVASAVKVPALFFLTLLVTLPSLYVFSALAGVRMGLGAFLRLLVAMVGVIAAVLASFGPIVVFFGISTTSYPFMKLLNVAACAVAGVLGLAFLMRALRALVLSSPAGDEDDETDAEETEADESSPAGGDDEASATGGQRDEWGWDWRPRRGAPDRAAVVFRAWIVLFALVGAQMSWVLRPFIGDPELPFDAFRSRESNFFIDVWLALAKLLGD